MDRAILMRHAGGAVLALALGGASPALANDIADVEHEKLGDLAPLFGTRTGVFVTLTDTIALGPRCQAPGASTVKRVTLTRTEGGLPRAESFDFAEGLRARGSCKIVGIPMRMKPEGKFTVTVEFEGAPTLETADETLESFEELYGNSPDDVVVSKIVPLVSAEDGKLGLSVDAAADLRLLNVSVFKVADDARLTFHGEIGTSGDSLAFKEALKLDSLFTWLFGPIGSYYEVVAKPIALEADDDIRTINYKGSIGLAGRVPYSVKLGRLIQGDGCDQHTHNCTSNGIIVGASYAANAKLKRDNGRFDRSDDSVWTFQAMWRLPISEQITFSAAYNWQSDSPDGSSSESSEVGVTVTPKGCKNLGFKLSFINGEFLPGQQRRDAVRVGLTSLLGAATGRGGC